MDDEKMKSLNRSEARIKYWASIPREQRSAHARNAAKKKAEKMTPQERREHAMKMVAGRLKTKKD